MERVAVDAKLTTQLRDRLSDLDQVAQKRIVGGVGFTWRGKLLCGVIGDELLFRIPRPEFDALVGEDGARPMAMARRQSKGWVLLPASVLSSHAVVGKWLNRAMGCVVTRSVS